MRGVPYYANSSSFMTIYFTVHGPTSDCYLEHMIQKNKPDLKFSRLLLTQERFINTIYKELAF